MHLTFYTQTNAKPFQLPATINPVAFVFQMRSFKDQKCIEIKSVRLGRFLYQNTYMCLFDLCSGPESISPNAFSRREKTHVASNIGVYRELSTFKQIGDVVRVFWVKCMSTSSKTVTKVAGKIHTNCSHLPLRNGHLYPSCNPWKTCSRTWPRQTACRPKP